MVTTRTDISVVIVNWNAGVLLARCIESLKSGTSGLAAETIVVDNASTDASVSGLGGASHKIRLVENAVNVGFATAANQGAALAEGRYLLFLNPDAEVPPGALLPVVRFADGHPGVGAVAPRLLNSDGSVQRSCWRRSPGLAMALVDAFYLWRLAPDTFARWTEYGPEELTVPREVCHALGACLLVPSDAWRAVGPFDEDYFLFLEETDWCVRAKKLGWPVFYFPDTAVVHHGQHSVRQQPAATLPQFYRSFCQFYRNNCASDPARVLALKSIIAAASLLRIGLWTVRRRRARSAEAADRAQAMVGGYKKVLADLAGI